MKIAIIGCGNMGGAIAKGIASDPAFCAFDLAVTNPSLPKLQALKAAYPEVEIFQDNLKALSGDSPADIIILAVKPRLVETVLDEITPLIGGSILVSVAASLPLDFYEAVTPEGTPVFRVIPNTAAAVGESMTVIAHNAAASAEDVKLVKSIFSALGKAEIIDESLMGAATALCSCGTAYAMRFVRAMMQGGITLGLKPDAAKEMALATIRGAVDLIEKNGSHPEAEIDKVTTPGGLTVKGLNKMEECGFSTAVIEGLKASVNHVC